MRSEARVPRSRSHRPPTDPWARTSPPVRAHGLPFQGFYEEDTMPPAHTAARTG